MLNLVIVIDTYLPRLGGAQKNVQAIGRFLAQNGYTVTVLTRRLPNTVKREAMEGVAVHRFGYFPLRIVSKLLFALSAMAYLIRHGNSADAILVAPVYYWPDLLPTFIASRLTRTPFIVRTTMAGSLDYLLGENHATGAERLKRIVLPASLWRRIFASAASITTQSAPIQAHAQQLGLDNAIMVYNGVDTERFKPVSAEKRQQLRSKLNLPVDKTIVITTSRYVAAKNLIALPRAAAQLDSNVFFLILGATQDQQQSATIKNELTAFVQENSLTERVALRDDVANVATYLQAADLFVLPSYFDEGMSNAVLEAMACGLPTICSDLPQLRAMFPDDLGRFFNSDDSAELAQEIQRLIDSADTRHDLSIKLAYLARTRYSIEQSAAMYAKLIRT